MRVKLFSKFSILIFFLNIEKCYIESEVASEEWEKQKGKANKIQNPLRCWLVELRRLLFCWTTKKSSFPVNNEIIKKTSKSNWLVRDENWERNFPFHLISKKILLLWAQINFFGSFFECKWKSFFWEQKKFKFHFYLLFNLSEFHAWFFCCFAFMLRWRNSHDRNFICEIVFFLLVFCLKSYKCRIMQEEQL